MGIFQGQSKLFTRVRVKLQMKGKLVGGVPKDPKLIQGWLRKNMGITDQQELLARVRETMLESGVEIRPDATLDELFAASEKISAERQTTGFKVVKRSLPDGSPMPKLDRQGNVEMENGRAVQAVALIIEGRQLKAMLKEVTNILFAGEKWGETRKGPKSFLAERVFVEEDAVILYRPDGEPFGGPVDADGNPTVEMMIGHVTGSQGPRSTLGYHEFVEGAILSFHLLVAQDAIPHNAWPDMWLLAEQNGLGATRSQSYGKFDVLEFEIVEQGDRNEAKRVRPRQTGDEEEAEVEAEAGPAKKRARKATPVGAINGHEVLPPNTFAAISVTR